MRRSITSPDLGIEGYGSTVCPSQLCSLLGWLLAAWIAASSPVLASVPDPFRPFQAGLETLDAPSAQTHQHNAADQIMSVVQAGPSSTNLPSFDPCGNMTQVVLSVKGQTFRTINRFDPENRLLGVTRIRNSPQGGSVTTSVMQLEYDAQGLLLQITDNGIVRRLVRDRTDALARPLVETDASGNAVRWFVWSNGRLLAQVQSNGTIRIALSDELGRTVALSDSNGALTDELAYHPYGRLIAHSGTTATPMTWLGGYGVWDAGHGLYLTRHRAYDANLCRFLQADPIGLQGGWNLYLYGNANPLFFLDVLGLCPDSPSWGQGGSQSYSSYNGAVLRAPVSAAEQQHWTDMSYGRVPVTQADYVQAQVNGAIMETAVLTALGGRGPAQSTPQHVFWSGGRTAEDAARSFATANNGVILADTTAGQAVSQATRGVPWSQARPQWVTASEDFARTASGEVNVFQNARGVSLDSIWRNEYRVLQQNPNVSGINYNMVMPGGLVVPVP